MLSLLTRLSKKKITEEKLANAFVNSVVDSVQRGFPEVAGLINEDPDFEKSPGIASHDDEQFLLIVLVGNIRLLSENFDPQFEDAVKEKVIEKCAVVFGMETAQFQATYREYCDFMNRVNHPSKNVLYGMTRALFYKYNLNHYQAGYFRTLNTPNPIFLKRMNEVMQNFIWNWPSFFERYKIVL